MFEVDGTGFQGLFGQRVDQRANGFVEVSGECLRVDQRANGFVEISEGTNGIVVWINGPTDSSKYLNLGSVRAWISGPTDSSKYLGTERFSSLLIFQEKTTTNACPRAEHTLLEKFMKIGEIHSSRSRRAHIAEKRPTGAASTTRPHRLRLYNHGLPNHKDVKPKAKLRARNHS